ncbi:helix-turn-helix transcriptional regulator [Magnetospirillum fulvum]|uniref:Autoinducer binding domain-containing protein n=1 Tax=Magnetospirillum fulvum TaxID=1082 RepID=A0A1H6H8A7_MAGFU|nr:helix-turn-helix transcriptional regulator [Magnetospirillum fulvum]SEH30338.1 Autoinducer binding domain-containing protein [Magnetospirillum fulvum]
MTEFDRKQGQRVLDAIADFQQSRDQSDLWSHVHRHLSHFGVGGIWYGFEIQPERGKKLSEMKQAFMLASLDPAYVDAKMNDLLIDDDYCAQMARMGTKPILWNDIPPSDRLTAAERRSFEIDADYKMISGVTMPSRFACGLGTSSFACHADGMSGGEFERMWGENGDAIQSIASAFDICLREGHMGEVYSLSSREREVLLWLTRGLRPQRIASRLSLHEGTVEKHIESARRKLKAATVTQAVATAVIFRLIAP